MGAGAELRDPAGLVLAAGAGAGAALTGLPPAAAVAVGAGALAAKAASALWLDARGGRPAPATVPVPEAVVASTAPPASKGTPDARDGPAANVFRPEGEYWTLGYRGSTFRLKDAKGLRHLHRLLGDPGREFHVADLALGPGEDGRRPDVLSDAGALLDAQAKAAYRRRLDELREEADEARAWGDAERESRAEDEIAALARELARAVGLHGADRSAASATERARVNVTRAVKAAIDRITEHDRALGHHLASTVRTGTFCSYVPAPDDPPAWEL